jgi:hypothetical protein
MQRQIDFVDINDFQKRKAGIIYLAESIEGQSIGRLSQALATRNDFIRKGDGLKQFKYHLLAREPLGQIADLKVALTLINPRCLPKTSRVSISPNTRLMMLAVACRSSTI